MVTRLIETTESERACRPGAHHGTWLASVFFAMRFYTTLPRKGIAKSVSTSHRLQGKQKHKRGRELRVIRSKHSLIPFFATLRRFGVRSLAAALDFLGFFFISFDVQNRSDFWQKKSKVMKAVASDRTPKSRVRRILTTGCVGTYRNARS